MKKAFFSIVTALCCCIVFSGCIKHDVNDMTINPTMTAMINNYSFTAATVSPSVIDKQVHDSTTTLVITGDANVLQATPGVQIILAIKKYKGVTGTFSIVRTEAGGLYIHNGTTSPAIAGIVSITSITSNSIIGYFSFTTVDGYAITNGSFNTGKPY